MSHRPVKPNPNRCPAPLGALLAETIDATGLTKSEIAERLGISLRQLYALIEKRKGLTPKVAVRIGKLFGCAMTSFTAIAVGSS